MVRIAAFITHAVVDSWHFKDRQADIIRKAIPHARITLCDSEQELVRVLPETDVVLTWFFRQEWFALAPNLKILSTPAAGKDYFKVTPPDGVVMLNGHFHGRFIGETVVGMILGMVRGILPSVTTYQQTPWARAELTPCMRTLCGSHVTIAGFGNIGRWIGRLIKPFGPASIWGMTRHADSPRPDWFDAADCIFTREALEARLALTDHLVLALPSTTGTDRMFGTAELRCLPPHATITNIGRGNAIDEEALMAALRDGRLGGAFLDVFAQEPLPADSPLRNCPRLWMMPHASAIAPDYLDAYAEEVAMDILSVLKRHNAAGTISGG